MKEVDLFDWLVRYHVDTNLAAALPYIREGNLLVTEGEENNWAKGCLVVSDGQTLAERLLGDKIILDRTAPEFKPVQNYDTFFEFLQHHGAMDGSFVYDGSNFRMARVARLKNSSPALDAVRDRALELIPPDFVFQGQEEFTWWDYDDSIGTKTDLAILIPPAYSTPGSNVHAYQVKRTGFGALGMGKVTQFGQQGLEQEFFLRQDHSSIGPFIDSELGIVGVHRTYARQGEKVVLTGEKLVPGATHYLEREAA
ncbi:MAG: hypothetical protein AABX37_03765 [Nanoarchaeota archaeon]